MEGYILNYLNFKLDASFLKCLKMMLIKPQFVISMRNIHSNIIREIDPQNYNGANHLLLMKRPKTLLALLISKGKIVLSKSIGFKAGLSDKNLCRVKLSGLHLTQSNFQA